MKIQRYGWKPQLPDKRDLKVIVPAITLPAKVDLRPNDVPVYDQGQLGSCTANAISAAYAFDLKKQNDKVFIPSRLFIYYNERAMEGTINTDAGANIRDGIKSINTLGVCDEAIWPYDIAKFKRKPTHACWMQGKTNKSVAYQAVPLVASTMKAVLAGGTPIVVGISVYNSFESDAVANTGVVPMPTANDQLIGGHAVVCVGYDDANQWWIMRNSWGTSWGAQGYFYLPYAYLVDPDLASDFWVVNTVTP